MGQTGDDFGVPGNFLVVTTTHVTREHAPVLSVTHGWTEADGTAWQFHSGDEDYRPEVLQLVLLDEILHLDPTLRAVARLPVDTEATRRSVSEPWQLRSLAEK